MSKYVQAVQTSQMLSMTALEEASRHGLRAADIEHLFLALVLSDQAAGQALRGMGISIDDARRAVREQHEAQLSGLGIHAELPEPGRIVFHETDGYDLKQRANDLIGRACGKNRDGTASSVLRELVAEPSGLIEDILRRLGTTPADVLDQLDRAEAADASAPTHRSKASGRASGSTGTFVPAPIDHVWEFLTNPARIPDWNVSVASIEDRGEKAVPGTMWHGEAPTAGPDGRPVKMPPQFRRRDIELVHAQRPDRIAWRFSYPDSPTSPPTLTEFALASTTGGTQVTITLSWTRHRGWRRLIGLPTRPLQKFLIWIVVMRTGAAVSRAFR